jgi:hypothetical protein
MLTWPVLDGKSIKARLEEGYHEGGYGNRSGWQVLSNSFSAAISCSVWNVLFVPRGVHAWAWGSLAALGTLDFSTISQTHTASDWCPVARDVGAGWSRILIFAALGYAFLFFFSNDQT